jgi:hypothetical protein
MDADTIRNLTETALISLSVLSPVGKAIVEKVGDSVADKIGEDLVEQGKRFYTLIHQRFSHIKGPEESYITPEILDDFIDNPKLYRPALEGALIDILQNDPTFRLQFSQTLGPIQKIIVGEHGKAIANQIKTNVFSSYQGIHIERGGVAQDNVMDVTITNKQDKP